MKHIWIVFFFFVFAGIEEELLSNRAAGLAGGRTQKQPTVMCKTADFSSAIYSHATGLDDSGRDSPWTFSDTQSARGKAFLLWEGALDHSADLWARARISLRGEMTASSSPAVSDTQTGAAWRMNHSNPSRLCLWHCFRVKSKRGCLRCCDGSSLGNLSVAHQCLWRRYF